MLKVDFIKYCIDNSTKSIQELANEIGITRVNFYSWLSGKTSPKKTNINNLAQILGYRVKWLNNDELELIKVEPSNASEPFHVPMDTRKAPVITLASAGMEKYPEILNMTDQFVSIPKGLPDDAFGVRVVGDSAVPRYDDGDVCIVSPNKPFINNKACFIALKNGEFYIKKVQRLNGKYHLISYNADYDPVTVKTDEVEAVLNILHTRHNV